MCSVSFQTNDEHMIIGEDFGLKNIIKMIRQVASLDSPVLLLNDMTTAFQDNEEEFLDFVFFR